mgnify:CR=1 FL=1
MPSVLSVLLMIMFMVVMAVVAVLPLILDVRDVLRQEGLREEIAKKYRDQFGIT